MTTLAKRLHAHFAVCASATASLALLGTVDEAAGGPAYSGVVNIPIPGNFGGVYLNVITGCTAALAIQ